MKNYSELQKLIAYHESGHVVGHWLCGTTISKVWISSIQNLERQNLIGSEISPLGETHLQENDGHEMLLAQNDLVALKKQVVISLAGWGVTCICCIDKFRGTSWSETMKSGVVSDLEQARICLSARGLSNELGTYQNKVLPLLKENWKLVEEIAEKLLSSNRHILHTNDLEEHQRCYLPDEFWQSF